MYCGLKTKFCEPVSGSPSPMLRIRTFLPDLDIKFSPADSDPALVIGVHTESLQISVFKIKHLLQSQILIICEVFAWVYYILIRIRSKTNPDLR